MFRWTEIQKKEFKIDRVTKTFEPLKIASKLKAFSNVTQDKIFT